MSEISPKFSDPRNLVDKYKGKTVEFIKSDLKKHAFPVHIAIENFQNDSNIGTIVRNANAFNVAGVHIIGKRHWNRRGAMMTETYLQLFHHSSVEDFIVWSKINNLEIYGIDNVTGSQNLFQSTLHENIILVFGQEGPGLSDEMKIASKSIFAIEQFGSTRSINVGVASGIILYEWIKQNVLITKNTN